MDRVIKKQKTENKTSVRYFEGLNLWILAAVFVANIFFQLSEVSSSLFLYVGTFVMVGTLFFLDKDDYIYVSVALLSVLRFSQVFDVSVINIITFVYFFQTYVFGNEYKREKEKSQLPKNVVIAGVAYILFSLVFILQDISGLRLTLIAVKLLFFLIYMVDVFRSVNDRKTAEKRFMNIQVYYVAGVLIAVFTSILINPEYSLDATRMSLSEGGGVNQLGISLASCLAFVTLGMTKVTNIKEWAVLAGTALPLLYFCFATQSRTAITGMIVIFASTMILGYAQKRARLWITLMAIASVLVLGGLIVFGEGTQIHENIIGTIERFVNPRGNDISAGRFDLWQMYIDKLTNNPKLFFFGGTIDDYNGAQAHNLFLEVFAAGGLVGTCIVLGLYATVFYEIKAAVTSLRKGKIRILGFMPFVLIFIIGMASHSLLNTEPTVNFCLGVAMIYFYGECDTEESDATDDQAAVEYFTKNRRYKNVGYLGRRYHKRIRKI